MTAPFVIGHDQGGNEVCLDYDNRRLSTYLIGRQGMGKSKLLLRMGLHDIEQGDGLCVITPDGDLIRDYLASIPEKHKDRVVLFDPTDMSLPMGLNIFSCYDPTNDLLVGQIAGDVVTKTFELLWKDSWGYQMEQIMRIVSMTITRCQGMPERERPTLTEFSTMLTKKLFRQKYVDYVRQNFASADWKVIEWWDDFEGLDKREREERIRSTLNKADKFAEQPTLANIFGQATSSLNFREIMDEQKILLVDLSKGAIGQENSRLIGAILVGQFYLAAISRSDILERERKPFHLIVDEFQNFATDAFFELHEEARKYAIDTVIAHQNLSQLLPVMQDRALGAGTKIVLQVTGNDAERLAGEFDATPPMPEASHLQPVYEPSSKPWTELLGGGRGNNEINALVERLSGYLESNVSTMYRHLHEATDIHRYQERVEEHMNWCLRRGMVDSVIARFTQDFIETMNVFHLQHRRLRSLLVVDFLSTKPNGERAMVLGFYDYGRMEGILKGVDDTDINYNAWIHSYIPFKYDNWAFQVRGTTRAWWQTEYDQLKSRIEEITEDEQQIQTKWLGENEERLKALISKEDWRDLVEKRKAYQLEKLAHWYRNATIIFFEDWLNFTEDVLALARLLRDHPISSPSVYHDTVLEKPRTYDDVRNENANALKKLERFHAWIASPDGSEHRNIKLLESDDYGDADNETAQYIRTQSRKNYGRDRRYVEAIIAARRQPQPTQLNEADDVPPPR